jgi:type IV pilus assembly protein PilE
MKREKGFTLIELMIVVAIIAIIAAFALFNYSKYGYRSRRVDGKDMLSRVAAAQERYYTNFNRYAPDLGTLNFVATGACGAVGYSEKCYYLVTTANGASGDAQSYSLVATPENAQATDACGTLTLTSANGKTYGGNQSNGNCW